MEFRLEIPGKPIAKRRQRFSRKSGRCYSDQGAEVEQVRAAIRQQFQRYRKTPLDEPVEVEFLFGFSPPPSWSAKKKAKAIAGVLRHAIKPDLDNLVKLVEDAMNDIVYRDDSLIDRIAGARKVYSDRDFTQLIIRTEDSGA